MPRPEVSFHTAGEQLPYNDSHIIIDQAYVQYIPPVAGHDSELASTTSSAPLLLVHGGGLTGAMWESTPDRRPGWAILATRPPYSRPVYCVDAVDSGRSQRCPDNHRQDSVEHRTVADMWSRFRFGPQENFSGDLLKPDADAQSPVRASVSWPDSKFPLEHLNRLLASQSARRRGSEQYEAEAKGLRDAILEIGQCDLLAHSNGCAVVILALLDDVTRSRIRRLVMVEPGPPHTESVDHLDAVRMLMLWGDHIGGHNMWKRIRAHYNKVRGDISVYDLPSMGIKGNSHFPMSDRNSDEIGRMVLDWLRDS